ncbi:UrcA family protein [Sphingomonas sp. ID1715]|uniref:UrcA family protein n=1 Tax=Sphingomonas sp. ID1715 TaxID=1656898 RepID=UPI00148A03D8|nr:UrcA family protein [Sphingomonas sp. ID1715]NNM78247.1 UrcA family protein [Sphingomonas sp. ID1715]
MFTRFVPKALLASLAAGVATFAFAPAHAELGAPRSVAVSYADLDLKSDGGKAQLKKRIAFAAEIVCGPADNFSYFSKKSVAGCQDRAISNASRGMVEVFANAESTIRVAAN